MPDTEAVILALAQAVEMRDQHTAGHCHRLALYSVALGRALGLTQEQLGALYRGGYLHDLGKVALPDSILFKPASLNEQEWETMRRHPEAGEAICRLLPSLAPVLPIIRSHHERWDGSGYPDGLRGRSIPLLARILQLADIYDALTSRRPYKDAYSREEALDIMQEETDRGWRDPELMDLFLKLRHGVLADLGERLREAVLDGAGMEQSLAELQGHLS